MANPADMVETQSKFFIPDALAPFVWVDLAESNPKKGEMG